MASVHGFMHDCWLLHHTQQRMTLCDVVFIQKKTCSPATPWAPLHLHGVMASTPDVLQASQLLLADTFAVCFLGRWPPFPRTQGAAFCVFSQVGRDFMPDPVIEAKVSSW